MTGSESSNPDMPLNFLGDVAPGPNPPPPTERHQGKQQAPSYGPNRIPPHDLEAERSVLGAILLNNKALDSVIEVGLEPLHFYKEAHRKIFETLLGLSAKGDPLDLVTVTAALRDRKWFEAVGGANTLTSLFEDSFAIANAAYYAKIVKEKYILRSLIETSSEIASEAFGRVTDITAFLDDTERKIFAVSQTKSTKAFTSVQEVLVTNMTQIEELSLKKEVVTGLPTGFVDFDRLTNGLHPGQLIVIAARPGMGKTSFVLSLVQFTSIQAKGVIAIFSLEMSKEELGFKLLSGVSLIDSKRLKIGRLQERDWPKLSRAADQLSRAKIFIDDSGDLTVMDIRARCRRLQNSEKKLSLIIIDYLQLMKGSKSKGGDDSRQREISDISGSLKALAKELKVPIIALSQLNRSVESRQDKRPLLSDLRESGAIEQDADMVAFIYRDEVYNKNTEDKGLAEFIIAKHRAGETDTIRLAWRAEYTLFANLADNSSGAPVMPPRPDQDR